jgi:hypothetical protein
MMEDLFNRKQEKKGVNKVFIAALLVGAVLIGGAVWVLSWKPSMEEQIARVLEGSYKPGSPEFEELNKDIIISTDDRTVQSPTGMGTIAMYINGKVRNRGIRTFDILEVNVAVVTQFNEVLRERRILVVPVQQPLLGPEETIPLTLTLDGFSPSDDRANIRWRVTAIRAVDQTK